MKSSYVIIERPVVTERALVLQESDNNPQYVFRVSRDANKIQIRRAVEEIYNVKVKDVNTIKVKGKVKRQGRFEGKQSDWKKAFVTLQKGQKIEY
jgi:large subunit ribosomal protein L23